MHHKAAEQHLPEGRAKIMRSWSLKKMRATKLRSSVFKMQQTFELKKRAPDMVVHCRGIMIQILK